MKRTGGQREPFVGLVGDVLVGAAPEPTGLTERVISGVEYKPSVPGGKGEELR